MTPKVKMCGLTRLSDVASAAKAGAQYVGFVFFAKSPRNVSVSQAAELALSVPTGIAKVALTVNADDATLDQIVHSVPLDMLQLHGHETPERVSELRARYGLPIMKAVGVADAEDLQQLEIYGRVADQLLVDAKPPRTAELPGGNGLAFDWRLVANRRWPVPWMLAGGLTPENVALAVQMTGAQQVDVSSGIEASPGVKDAERMDAFVKALSV